MPHIDPISRQAAAEQGLGRVMDAFAEMGDQDAVFPRILAHAPNYAQALGDALATSLLDGGVDHNLKEIVRIQLARTAADPYFSGLRSRKALAGGLSEARIDAGSFGSGDADEFTPAEKWALRYAYLMYRHPERVDNTFYEEGKQHFTEAQIMEIGGMIAVHYGMQVFMSTLQDGSDSKA